MEETSFSFIFVVVATWKKKKAEILWVRTDKDLRSPQIFQLSIGEENGLLAFRYDCLLDH